MMDYKPFHEFSGGSFFVSKRGMRESKKSIKRGRKI